VSDQTPVITDQELVKRTLGGDQAAFVTLVRRYERGLYNLAYRMVRDPELARDLTQDVLIRVHGSLAKYDPIYPFASWVYRVASNLCIDFIRRRKLQTISLDAPVSVGHGESVPREVPDTTYDPGRTTEESERARILAEALDKLPETHRLILILRHQRELSYEEIAIALDAPLGTVKARIHRAREAFRKILVRDYRMEDLMP
jgi:RNA polymerase sigma-70 factor (ECF subfamily)